MDQALKNASTRHNGIDNVVNGQTSFTPYSETENWQGFQFLRSSFDHMLATEAQRLGESVHFQALPRDLSKDTDGNITEVSGANFIVRSSFVIDATGPRRWMARHLSLQYGEFSPKLLAWYGYVECRNSSTFRIPKFIWTAKGWIWLADVGDGRISWACLDVINQKRRRIDWIRNNYGIAEHWIKQEALMLLGVSRQNCQGTTGSWLEMPQLSLTRHILTAS